MVLVNITKTVPNIRYPLTKQASGSNGEPTPGGFIKGLFRTSYTTAVSYYDFPSWITVSRPQDYVSMIGVMRLKKSFQHCPEYVESLLFTEPFK